MERQAWRARWTQIPVGLSASEVAAVMKRLQILSSIAFCSRQATILDNPAAGSRAPAPNSPASCTTGRGIDDRYKYKTFATNEELTGGVILAVQRMQWIPAFHLERYGGTPYGRTARLVTSHIQNMRCAPLHPCLHRMLLHRERSVWTLADM